MESTHNTAVLSAILSVVSVSVFQVGNNFVFVLLSDNITTPLFRGYLQSVLHDIEDPPSKLLRTRFREVMLILR